MTKKFKSRFVEDSFDFSNYAIQSNINKWFDAEKERFASKVDKDDDNLYLFCDPEINEGSVWCEDYIMKFNRVEWAIDLVINSEEGSPVWKDVVCNVPTQFASYLGAPEIFLYRVSTSTSDKKEFCGFLDEGQLIRITEFTPSGAWRAENFDSLISSMYNIVNAF